MAVDPSGDAHPTTGWSPRVTALYRSLRAHPSVGRVRVIDGADVCFELDNPADEKQVRALIGEKYGLLARQRSDGTFRVCSAL